VSDASERFLDLAIKPLEGNHELQVHARWELGEKLKVGVDDELEDASKRLEQSDQSKWKPKRVLWGLILFGVGLLGLSASMWVPKRNIALLILGLDRLMDSPEYLVDADRPGQKPSHLSAEDQMLFEEKFNKLKELHPTQPLYFATSFQKECDREQEDTWKVPLALLDRVSKIDPDNGWWPYIAANSFSAHLELTTEPASKQTLHWKRPERQEIVDLAMRLFHNAAAAPRYESYQNAIRSRVIALSPRPETVQESVSKLVHLRTFDMGRRESTLLLDQILPNQAQILADRKDTSGFRMLLCDWIKLSTAQAKDFNRIDELRLRTSSYRAAILPLLKAAQDLGLHEEARALEVSNAILDKQDQPFQTNRANQRAFHFHGSYLTFETSLSGGVCSRPSDYFEGRYPPMTVERLKPNRRSEHAYTAQLLILPLGLLLLVGTTVLFLFRFRNGRLCREISGRMADLFDRRDWFHCVGFGVLLPILYFAVIRYFTPFGGLDWYAGSDGQHLEIVRFILLFLLMVSCSLLVLRRRVKTRMSYLESPDRKGTIGVILTISGFASLPLLGSCFRVVDDRYVRLNMAMIYPVLLVMGALLIWLIALAFRFLFGRPEQALRRQILSRLMVRTMICAFAIVCGTIPLHMLEERFWVKRDTVLRADPGHPARTRYEWEVIQQMKGELLEVLAPLEAISR
jgi:hypothetical protein